MAKTKTKTKARRKKTLSAGTKRRSRSRRGLSSKGILSDFTNPTMLMNSAKNTLSAASGGAGAVIINKILPPTTGKFARLMLALGGGFLACMVSMPNLGAGFTGGMIANSFPNGFLAEEANFADEDSLSDMPVYLDENGSPMILEEGADGSSQMRYLDENEIQMLEEAGAFSDFVEVT